MFSCPFVVLPLPPSSCFFVYFVLFVVQTLLGLRFCIFVSIRVHSWFKPVFGLRSCPFVSIRGSPSSPSFVFFRVFRAFRGSNTAWTTFLYIRVHSCPFVVQTSIWTTFVSIRVHSWFSLFPLLRVFSCISCFSWFKHCLDYVFVYSCPFVSIRGSNQYLDYVRVHSCPFVVLPLHPPSCFFVLFVLFVVQTLLGPRFLHICVHSCPFVVQTST